MTPSHLKKEADFLLSHAVLNLALDTMRREALEDLATADAEEIIDVLRHQQRVAAVDEFRGMLRRFILAHSSE